MNCESCKEVEVHFWDCVELKDKIHPSLLAAFQANRDKVIADKKWYNRIINKIKSLVGRLK